ncbi:hypothetical protein EV182_006302 [Spiromyces aspiralis]|uniref:Uncharacterized protein n=1 Tax=Spiromyces aspiralis TaxID=68401 RepID=A0ACC1HC11_9FUNG|nr:hypothetical protein EV182_006302 [Spiromyces aspiralis]
MPTAAFSVQLAYLLTCVGESQTTAVTTWTPKLLESRVLKWARHCQLIWATLGQDERVSAYDQASAIARQRLGGSPPPQLLARDEISDSVRRLLVNLWLNPATPPELLQCVLLVAAQDEECSLLRSTREFLSKRAAQTAVDSIVFQFTRNA